MVFTAGVTTRAGDKEGGRNNIRWGGGLTLKPFLRKNLHVLKKYRKGTVARRGTNG